MGMDGATEMDLFGLRGTKHKCVYILRIYIYIHLADASRHNRVFVFVADQMFVLISVEPRVMGLPFSGALYIYIYSLIVDRRDVRKRYRTRLIRFRECALAVMDGVRIVRGTRSERVYRARMWWSSNSIYLRAWTER